MNMAHKLTAACLPCLYPQIHDPGWRFHCWKWSVLCYTTVHTLISDVLFVGTGGESIYGEKFEDEAFAVKHTRPFFLSMVRRSPAAHIISFSRLTGLPAGQCRPKHQWFTVLHHMHSHASSRR